MSQNKEHKSVCKQIKGIGWGISIIQLVLSVLTGILIFQSGLLTRTYEIAVGIILLFLLVIVRWLMWHYHPKKRFYIGFVLGILLCILYCVGDYYLYDTIHTVKKITDAKTETTIYGVYVLKDDSAECIADTVGYSYGIMQQLDRDNTNQVIERIEAESENITVADDYEDMIQLAGGLLEKKSQAIVLNEAYLAVISETEGYENFSEQVKEIGNYDITVNVEPQQGTVTIEDDSNTQQGVFTVFISGIDVAGPISTTSRSDVNILAVVNPNTHQILLVSTPRDYYVPLSISNGVRDKLTHAGIYGINTSMDTLGMLYSTKIDYYFRVNFSGFEQVIDALGGVSVESDYAFTSSFNGYNFVKGINNLDAKQALFFARERYAFAEGTRWLS